MFNIYTICKKEKQKRERGEKNNIECFILPEAQKTWIPEEIDWCIICRGYAGLCF